MLGGRSERCGQDALLNAARIEFRDDKPDRIPRGGSIRVRQIPDGEDHEPVTDAKRFAARDFVLSWSAHGLRCPAFPVRAFFETYPVLVANVSRGVIAEAASRTVVQVIHEVTAHFRNSFAPPGGQGQGKSRQSAISPSRPRAP